MAKKRAQALAPSRTRPIEPTTTAPVAQQRGPSWPTNVRYLTDYEFDSHVPTDVRRSVLGDSPMVPPRVISKSAPPPISGNVVVRFLEDPTHPAYPYRGLFAAKPLKPGTHILDYIGVVYANSSYSATSDYVLTLSRDACVDAEAAGNEARFINDYRGIPSRANGAGGANGRMTLGPNAEFRERVDAHGVLRMGVYVLAKPAIGIRKGEEICVSYGKGWWRER
ncbi:hypothetical protein BC828DRAFT_344338, partial [Blastocladiella britannica]